MDKSPDPTAQRRDEVLKRMLNTPPQPRVSPKKKKASLASGANAPVAKPET